VVLKLFIYKGNNVMAPFEHKYFLLWFLFVTFVSFMAITGFYLGLLGPVFEGDQTYISHSIGMIYIITELYVGYKIYRLSQELNHVIETDRIYDAATVIDIKTKSKILNDVIGNLVRKKNADPKLLLENTDDQISVNNQGPFLSEIMIRAGLFGTIIGLIIAFYPFIQGQVDGSGSATLTADQTKLIIGSLFQGVATAFYTTAVGLFCGTLITISSRFYEMCQSQIMNKMTVLLLGQIHQPLEIIKPAGGK